jgi:hypothetical protein
MASYRYSTKTKGQQIRNQNNNNQIIIMTKANTQMATFWQQENYFKI